MNCDHVRVELRSRTMAQTTRNCRWKCWREPAVLNNCKRSLFNTMKASTTTVWQSPSEW